jgi:hypothetical protein
MQALLRLEADFLQRRESPPDLAGAIADAWAMLPPAPPPAQAAAAAIERVISERANGHAEPPYHDRYHIAEVVRAMAALLAQATQQDLLDAEHAAIGLVAMVGHDLDHDGSCMARTPSLEAIAAARADALAAAAGLDAKARALLGHVIMGTTTAEVGGNARRAAGQLPPGPFGAQADLLRALANEADGAASLTPTLGWRLSDALAREWRDEAPDMAARVASCIGRLTFLTHFPAFSRPATALGFAAVRDAQVEAMAAAAGTASPRAGATWLDRLDPVEARARLARAVAERL